MASTRSRPPGREHARPTTGGPATEHATKIYTVATVGTIIIVLVLTLTSIGHTIDLATQHFLLFYAGVVALMALCTSVCFGLISTDRMFLHPGQRVFIQAAHRAASFGSVAFLIIHIVTEILAQRIHVIDAVVPFLSPFKTFYIGIGTIAGDIMIVLAITGIMRGRFTASGKAWRWRAIHYTSYVAFIFGIWHGLLGGRPAKPYYDWTYGVIVALALLGLGVRALSTSLRPKENLSAPPVAQGASSASAPLRAAAMLAQYGGTRVGKTAIMGGPATGAQPTLSAPVTATVLTALPVGEETADTGQPYYEPGYEGPQRYLGAPRATGPMPEVETGPVGRPATGPMPRANTGSMPRATGAMPRAATGSMPRAATGSMPRVPTGPTPTSGPGPMPPSATGPMPRSGSGPVPRPGSRPGTGSMPRAATGAFPAPPPGPPAPPAPQSWTGPMPRAATGAMPQYNDGYGAGSPGFAPRGPAGSQPYADPEPASAWSDPRQRMSTGPLPQDGGQRDYQDYQDGQPDYQDWPEAAPDQGWLEASHDGDGYPGQPPWEGYLPESEPDLRYREPGPGMPGYRGSREQRYGGDRY